ncbi:ShlB/FhaC/HecB family hemolysin secretion/activation protein [bacterium]|nr:ShlB/FhaC/HecB family hemolysin secretion/activation protein [bacterium]
MLLSSLSVNAENANLLQGASPQVINKQNQMQYEGSQFENKYIKTVPSDLDKESSQFQPKEEKDTVKGNLTYNPKFVLNKVIFSGNKKFSDKKLQKLVGNMVGKEVYLDDVMDLTVKVSRFYQQQGYLTSYAFLSPQEIKDGIVTINIKESTVASKEVVGNKWERPWYFKNVAMSGSGLQQDKIFNAKDLQGTMKNINKESYMKASAEIQKDKDDNTIVKLHVADRFPLKLNFAWDDFGRNYSGRQRATGIIGLDNVTGIGDKIYGGAILSHGTTGAVAGYQVPINKRGTTLSFDYSHSHVNLGGPYRDLNIVGNASDYAIRLTHPLINTATKELYATISLDAVDSTSESYALHSKFSDYQLRVLRTGLYGMFDDKHGRFITNLGVDFGTSGLGGSDNIANGPQSTFYKFIAGLTRVERLPKNCLGIVRINGQYSPQSLYSSEQMYLGGVYSMRGYQPSEVLGDYGVAGTFEIRTPIPGLKRILPEKVKGWSDRVKLAAFYDWGWIQDHHNLYGYPRHFLSSVGFGTYIYLTDAISFQMGVGMPIGPKDFGENSGRLYFSINTDLDKIFLKPKERL